MLLEQQYKFVWRIITVESDIKLLSYLSSNHVKFHSGYHFYSQHKKHRVWCSCDLQVVHSTKCDIEIWHPCVKTLAMNIRFGFCMRRYQYDLFCCMNSYDITHSTLDNSALWVLCFVCLLSHHYMAGCRAVPSIVVALCKPISCSVHILHILNPSIVHPYMPRC